MTPEQKAAFFNSQVACALIEAAGMTAENEKRKFIGGYLAYDKTAFDDLINKYGIHHNAAIEFLQD